MRAPAVLVRCEMVAYLRRHLDVLVGALILLVSFWVFRQAPVQQAGDSRYTMLLAENIIEHHDFALERYHLPDPDYRLEASRGHRYYYFPPGSSLLSVPFVALMHLRGVRAIRGHDLYNVVGELFIDARLAAIVMAALGALAYFMARVLLPVPWSVGISCMTVFGTQVLSTASRSMWSDTWGITLVAYAFLLLLQDAAQAKRLNVGALATVVMFSYVVRPTNSLVVAGASALPCGVPPRSPPAIRRCRRRLGGALRGVLLVAFSVALAELLRREPVAVRRAHDGPLRELGEPEPRASSFTSPLWSPWHGLSFAIGPPFVFGAWRRWPSSSWARTLSRSRASFTGGEDIRTGHA